MNGMSMSEFLNGSFDEGNMTELEKQYLRSMYPEADWDGDGETTDEERLTAYKNIQFATISFGNPNSELTLLNIGDTLKADDAALVAILIDFVSDSNSSMPKGKVKINVDFKYVFSQA